MPISAVQQEVIQRSKASSLWWMRNFVRIKHPGAGIIPFEPFDYQQGAVKSFRKHRFNIFKKCRQSGISKIAGIFALWYGMFSPHKTILVVSRTDSDAMKFLDENIRIPFQNLPEWMKDLWEPLKDNEHTLWLPNGSKIQSLTSNKDVLRSNASSLNIIDEAAFIMDMDAMWAGGLPTLQHGGSVIVISTTNGVGNWYWNTWTDAEAGLNNFHPLVINWWDMHWKITYRDVLSGEQRVIAPTDGIRECRTKEEIERYGKYWSPWLEGEWRQLQEKGESWKFSQEILAEFIGSGNTVLPKSVLVHVSTTVKDDYKLVTGPQTYVHPVTSLEQIIDFTPDEQIQGLWVWREPVAGTADTLVNNRVVEKGSPAHSYVMGVDVATGKGNDYSAIEVFDIDAQEQAAELMIRCYPSILKLIIDRIGRWYNVALAVIERNNGGDDLIDDIIRELAYPRVWRKTEANDRPTKGAKARPVSYSHYGHFTSTASKPLLNKYLLDNVRDTEGTGYRIYSRRLYKQLTIYVRKKDRAGRDTGKTEAETGPGNHDDLVMAAALALLGAPDATSANYTTVMPLHSNNIPWTFDNNRRAGELHQKFVGMGGIGLMMPSILPPTNSPEESITAEIQRFTQQLGIIRDAQQRDKLPPVTKRRHQL